MNPEISPSTMAIGFWSAVPATLFSLAYDIGQRRGCSRGEGCTA